MEKKLYNWNKYNVRNGFRIIIAKHVYEETSKAILSRQPKGMLYKIEYK